ncbi:hypothetical protein BJB45_10095 [Halomonas huangheensis]|uniref:Uncharacterized protein n=1 Tax=Halomonas huangheensis TaxID=1178482 RepID=W1N9Y0_9GAMM|nr:hypothetical protein BJB45_10095 [Halomonas huangheensis]
MAWLSIFIISELLIPISLVLREHNRDTKLNAANFSIL